MLYFLVCSNNYNSKLDLLGVCRHINGLTIRTIGLVLARIIHYFPCNVTLMINSSLVPCNLNFLWKSLVASRCLYVCILRNTSSELFRVFFKVPDDLLEEAKVAARTALEEMDAD